MTERVTLKPGDYVSTEGVTEEQYRAVEKAFLHAGGRSDGDHGFEKYVKGGSSSFLGWDKRSGEMWDCGHCAMGFARHLTPAQVIGAVNAGNQQEETMDNDFKLKCILHSAQTYLDEEQEELERSDFHRVKAMQKRDRHDEMMQRARDMLPDGWRLVRDGQPDVDMSDPANWREGDVIEWIEESSNFFTAGKRYTILAPEKPEEDDFDVIDDDNERHAWDFAPAGKSFRFHSRPTT